MLHNTVIHDPIQDLLRQRLAAPGQLQVLVTLPANLLPVPKGGDSHHIRRDQITEFTAIIRRPEA